MGRGNDRAKSIGATGGFSGVHRYMYQGATVMVRMRTGGTTNPSLAHTEPTWMALGWRPPVAVPEALARVERYA